MGTGLSLHSRRLCWRFGLSGVPAVAEPIVSRYRFADTDVIIDWRSDDRWAICSGGFCYSREGDFEIEPMPSNRTDEFLARCRYTLAEALALADSAIRKYPLRYGR